jgi:hypothetical protein
MNKIISFEEFKKDPHKKGISNFQLQCLCENCGLNFIIKQIKSFRRRDCVELRQLCNSCYLNFRCYSNPEWLKKNSEAQIVSQNKPEQKIKNALGVSRSWSKERRNLEAERMRHRWKNATEDQKQKMLKCLDWKSESKDGFHQKMKKTAWRGGSDGIFNGIKYESILELSFLIECFERGINVKRYNLGGIKYLDPNGKERLYFPDFIIFNKVVVEIKGHIWGEDYGHQIFSKKIEAAKKSLTSQNLKFRVFFRSKFLKKTKILAKTIHETNQ